MASEGVSRPFHERFDIEVGADEARQRFINRVSNDIFDLIIYRVVAARRPPQGMSRYQIHRTVANALGVRYEDHFDLDLYVNDDFHRCLRTLEALYELLEGTAAEKALTESIEYALSASEVDLEVGWQPPQFVRTGAKFLDESLVNEPLHWLSEPKYEAVRKPFEKGLVHYTEAANEPDRLSDVVTDFYEAAEALARFVTGKDRDLSGNRELFISKIKASDHYKKLLRDYIDYANQYRHAAPQGKPKAPPSEPEVESFIYLTGLFIRLAIRQAQPST